VNDCPMLQVEPKKPSREDWVKDRFRYQQTSQRVVWRDTPGVGFRAEHELSIDESSAPVH
jgi:hypothetical protein